VLGRSSGGYLAKVLFDQGEFDRAIYLAPVFTPLIRGIMVPKLGKRQSPYFTDQHVPSTDSWSPDKELLLLAT